MQPARPLSPRFPAEKSRPFARRRGASAAALGFCALASGCFLGDTAVDPPLGEMYYPTGLVRAPGGATLYVINSDFDLQYNGGTVLALDLSAVRSKLVTLLENLRSVGVKGSPVTSVAKACGLSLTTLNPTDRLNPGPCSAIPLAQAAGALLPAATIGAFGSGAVLVQRQASPVDARLFIPVRGDPSITFFDVDPAAAPTFTGLLDCTGSGARGSVASQRCADNHVIGTNPFESTRSILLPTEPVGIAASEDGTAIVVAHQTSNSVSLTIDDPRKDTTDAAGKIKQGKPTLEFVLGGLPAGPTEVVTVPIPALIKDRVERKASTQPIDYQPGFLVTYKANAVIDLLRVHEFETGTPRPFLSRATESLISVNADGKDSRGIAIDGGARKACESTCADASTTCHAACDKLTNPADKPACDSACAASSDACNLPCVNVPIDVFIANRAPPSLLIGRIETTTVPQGSATPTSAVDRVIISDSFPLAQGASKVIVGNVIDPLGKLSRRVFVAAFDSHLVFSYDPALRHIDSIVNTGRGPQSLAYDDDAKGSATPDHAFLIIGQFTDSYLGVVDLDMRHPTTFGTVFASVGTPNPPRDSK